MSQELLAAKIKLLKSKNKSVESSPVSTPHHQTRQLSLQRSSKSSGQTDSDSSGTSSPILLSRHLTPPPPGINLPPSHSHSDTVVGVAPRVVVTTSDSCADTAKTETIESRPESGNSGDSLFLDATDNRDFQLLNSNSGGRAEFSNLNSDSVDTSESAQREDMVSSTSSDSDVATEVEESWQKLPFMSSLCSSLPTAGRSPDTQFDGPREDSGIVFRVGRGEGGEEREGERDSVDQLAAGDEAGGSRVVSSVLQEVLGRVHIHPTRIGLWRLQRGRCARSLPKLQYVYSLLCLQHFMTGVHLPTSSTSLLSSRKSSLSQKNIFGFSMFDFFSLIWCCRIFLLLISTASMLCRLSYVNPAFQPFVTWQPWCRLCSECRSSGKPHPPGGVAHDRAGGGERGGLWTLDFFEELVEKHGGNCEPPEVFDAGDKVSDNQHS